MTQLGKYEILEEIGKGGFGIVYKARDTSLDRLVALKVLHPQLTVDANFLRRFRAEAQSLARINHPNVVTIHEIGEVAGQVYIAMEYLPGGSLGDKLAKGSLSLSEAIKITNEIGQGLSAGHEKGLIHRDVKPGNILFNERGEAIIADFGLAKAMQVSSTTVASSYGAAVGTPYYRAPELWNGTPAPSPATDIYSLACVFYEMITGQVLFSGDTPMIVMTKHAQGPDFTNNPPLPSGIIKTLQRALEKEPRNRYGNMPAFHKALKAISSTDTAFASVKSEMDQPKTPNIIKLLRSVDAEGTKNDVFESDSRRPTRKEVETVAKKSDSRRKIPVWAWGIGSVLLLLVMVLTAYGLANQSKDDLNMAEQVNTLPAQNSSNRELSSSNPLLSRQIIPQKLKPKQRFQQQFPLLHYPQRLHLHLQVRSVRVMCWLTSQIAHRWFIYLQGNSSWAARMQMPIATKPRSTLYIWMTTGCIPMKFRILCLQNSSSLRDMKPKQKSRVIPICIRILEYGRHLKVLIGFIRWEKILLLQMICPLYM